MKWLIDIGNSRMKSALFDGARLRDIRAVSNDGIADAELWTSTQMPDSAWIASVGGDALDRQVADLVSVHTGKSPHFVRSTAQACGVRNAYAEPQRLGVDRFLTLIAVHAKVTGMVIVAGCGTALTLDAIDSSGRHLGGLIAPSPDLMQASLRERTARLRDVADTAVVEMATDTDSAVTSGTWLAAVALVERFVAQTRHRGETSTLVLTGGGADRLTTLIAIPHVVRQDLVLEGLAIYADTHD